MRNGFAILLAMLLFTPLFADYQDGFDAAVRTSQLRHRVCTEKNLPSSFPDSSNYDVECYSIDLEFLIPTSEIKGNCQMLIHPFEGDSITFDMGSSLVIDSLLVDTTRTEDFIRSDNLLTVNLPEPADTTSPLYLISIFYHGTPTAGYYRIPNKFGENVFFTFTEPSDSRLWFPCKDDPSDKAPLLLSATVPDGYLVASNGELTSVDTLDGDRVKFNWQENFPIAPYLIAVSIFPYTLDTLWVADTLPVWLYYYPDDSENAVYDWYPVTEAINIYSRFYGSYPFEKYGMCEAPIMWGWGAMEHQTITTFGDNLVTGDRSYITVVAHELSHHWWGDMVTCGTWKDIWINEGFAVFSEALYVENAWGEEDGRGYVGGMHSQYIEGESREGRFPIYDPDYMWGVTVYEKGGAVLDMLRFLLGDSLFFNLLSDYADSFRYSYATISDFQRIAEETTGEELDWFFNQWIYEAGYPQFDYYWNSYPTDSGTYHTIIQVEQVQEDAPLFRVPLVMRLRVGGEFVVDTVMIEATRWNRFEYDFPEIAVVNDFNYHNHALCTYRFAGTGIEDITSSLPEKLSLTVFPNPFNLSVVISTNREATVEIFDIKGDKLSSFTVSRKASWCPEHLSSGVYIIRATSGNEIATSKALLLK